MENSQPLIDIGDVTKVYRMGDLEVHALRGVSLQIYPGEMMAIMGASGSGKSTLMNILGALDVPTSGTYLLDGQDVSKMDDDRLAEIRNRKIGFVFQSFNLLPRTSALANVELPLIYAGVTNSRNRCIAALESVGLGDRLHHKPNEMSGGQQQRVAIARALVNEPSLILADEPTGNLDSVSGEEVMRVFQELNATSGITIGIYSRGYRKRKRRWPHEGLQRLKGLGPLESRRVDDRGECGIRFGAPLRAKAAQDFAVHDRSA